MDINEYFKEYDNKYFQMKDKLVELKEAEFNFYNLTGFKFSDYPKNHSVKGFDFSDQIERIESLIDEYKDLEKKYLDERKKSIEDVNKISKPLYRTIIILAFIEKKKNKTISNILNKTYKLDYSMEYIKNIKTKAINAFQNVIKND